MPNPVEYWDIASLIQVVLVSNVPDVFLLWALFRAYSQAPLKGKVYGSHHASPLVFSWHWACTSSQWH
jgi:hypothetical protein